jgi:predicted metal-dependent hydrolase
MVNKETAAKKNLFKDRVRRWAGRLDADVTSVSIRAMKNKWASYSTTGRLTFDITLLDVREALQDYVIVHELLHAHVPNHGRLWKSLMKAHIGDYEKLETELKSTARQARAFSSMTA